MGDHVPNLAPGTKVHVRFEGAILVPAVVKRTENGLVGLAFVEPIILDRWAYFPSADHCLRWNLVVWSIGSRDAIDPSTGIEGCFCNLARRLDLGFLLFSATESRTQTRNGMSTDGFSRRPASRGR